MSLISTIDIEVQFICESSKKTSDSKKIKLVKLYPVEYFGYRLELGNYFLDEEKNELVNLKCPSNQLIRDRCNVLPTHTDLCAQALKSNLVIDVVDKCKFRKNEGSDYSLTLDGIYLNDPKVRV